jgi:hypothetical protein
MKVNEKLSQFHIDHIANNIFPAKSGNMPPHGLSNH